jgi:ParB family chromosome partitioning protein
LGAKKPEKLLHQVVSRELNVRQTEALVKPKNNVQQAGGEQRDPNTIELEQDLTNLLGLRVSIKNSGESGKITINYNSLEQLDEVLFVLRGKQPGGL